MWIRSLARHLIGCYITFSILVPAIWFGIRLWSGGAVCIEHDWVFGILFAATVLLGGLAGSVFSFSRLPVQKLLANISSNPVVAEAGNTSATFDGAPRLRWYHSATMALLTLAGFVISPSALCQSLFSELLIDSLISVTLAILVASALCTIAIVYAIAITIRRWRRLGQPK